MKWRTGSAFVAAGILSGSGWLPYSFVLGRLPRFWLCALWFGISAISAALLAAAMRLYDLRKGQPPRPFNLSASAILSVTAVGLPNAVGLWAVDRVSPGLALTIFAFMPLAAFFLGGETTAGVIPKLTLGIAGVALLVARGVSLSAGQLQGAFAIAAAMILGAFSLVYARRRLRDCDLLASTAIQFALAALLLAVLSLGTEHGQFAHVNWKTAVSLLVLGIASGAIIRPLLYWLLVDLQPWQVASVQWIMILAATVEAGVLLSFAPSLQIVAGGAITIAAAVWLLHREANEAGQS
jgi:drug/metabolite transporter (DMT)-like permease